MLLDTNTGGTSTTIDPTSIPVFDGDLAAVEAAASRFTAAGGQVERTGVRVHASFQALAGSYRAPESGELLASTVPVRTKATAFGEQLATVGRALATYVYQMRPIASRLQAVQFEASAFVVEQLPKGEDWRDDPAAVARNNELIATVNDLVAARAAVERECANAINRLVGGPSWHASGQGTGPYQYGPGVIPPSAPTPWGRPAQPDLPWWRVFWQFVTKGTGSSWQLSKSYARGFFVDGLVGSLQGMRTLSGSTVLWEQLKLLVGHGSSAAADGAALQTVRSWRELGLTAAGLILLTNPIAAPFTAGLSSNPTTRPWVEHSGESLRETAKSLVAWDTWKHDPARALGTTMFNALTAYLPTKGASTFSRSATVVDDASRVARATPHSTEAPGVRPSGAVPPGTSASASAAADAAGSASRGVPTGTPTTGAGRSAARTAAAGRTFPDTNTVRYLDPDTPHLSGTSTPHPNAATPPTRTHTEATPASTTARNLPETPDTAARPPSAPPGEPTSAHTRRLLDPAEPASRRSPTSDASGPPSRSLPDASGRAADPTSRGDGHGIGGVVGSSGRHLPDASDPAAPAAAGGAGRGMSDTVGSPSRRLPDTTNPAAHPTSRGDERGMSDAVGSSARRLSEVSDPVAQRASDSGRGVSDVTGSSARRLPDASDPPPHASSRGAGPGAPARNLPDPAAASRIDAPGVPARNAPDPAVSGVRPPSHGDVTGAPAQYLPESTRPAARPPVRADSTGTSHLAGTADSARRVPRAEVADAPARHLPDAKGARRLSRGSTPGGKDRQVSDSSQPPASGGDVAASGPARGIADSPMSAPVRHPSEPGEVTGTTPARNVPDVTRPSRPSATSTGSTARSPSGHATPADPLQPVGPAAGDHAPGSPPRLPESERRQPSRQAAGGDASDHPPLSATAQEHAGAARTSPGRPAPSNLKRTPTADHMPLEDRPPQPEPTGASAGPRPPRDRPFRPESAGDRTQPGQSPSQDSASARALRPTPSERLRRPAPEPRPTHGGRGPDRHVLPDLDSRQPSRRVAGESPPDRPHPPETDQPRTTSATDDPYHSPGDTPPTHDGHHPDPGSELRPDEAAGDTARQLTWDDVADDLPTDPSGYQLRPRDCDYLGISPEQVHWWKTRQAPLGMTPDQYKSFRSDLRTALETDGVDVSDVDVRLQGSAARFYSGGHKHFPAPGRKGWKPSIADQLANWFGDDPARPTSRPFDSGHKLGISPRSDYDIQISSDTMFQRVHEFWSNRNARGPFTRTRYGFVDRNLFEKCFPELRKWRKRWQRVLHREVPPVLFPSSGPPPVSRTGLSAAFAYDDWIVDVHSGE